MDILTLIKKTFAIFSIFLFIISCKKENQLSGIWLAAYQVHSSDETSVSSPRLLIQFEGNIMTAKSLDLAKSEDEISGPYHIERDNLVYKLDGSEPDTLKIVSISDDSLVFEIMSFTQMKIVFRRFKEEASPENIDIEGKAYAIKSLEWTDSIEIVDSNHLIHSKELINQVEPWAIKEFKKYKFLIVGQFAHPLFISSVSSDTIRLLQAGKKITPATMTSLPNTTNPSHLLGSWREVQRHAGESYPPWIEKIKLDINKDSIKIVEGKNITTRRWKLDATGSWIYFPDEINSDSIHLPWKVVNTSHNKLTIERRPLHLQYNNERIEFVNIEASKNK